MAKSKWLSRYSSNVGLCPYFEGSYPGRRRANDDCKRSHLVLNTERSSHTRANYEVVCISKNILFRDERERDGLWIEKHQLWHRTGWILWSNQAQCRRQSSLLTAGEQEMFKGTEQAVVFLTILLIYFHPPPQQELQMLGLPSLLSEGAIQLETSRAINVMHQLLQLHRHHLKIIDELKDR